MLSTLDGPSYIARCAVDTVPHIREAKKSIKKAFEYQMEGRGLSFVEILSVCPTNWGMSPVEAIDRLQKEMVPYYPLGVYRDEKEAE